MALFSKTKKEQVVKAPAVEKTVVSAMSAGRNDLSHVLKHARITEKASMSQGGNVYVFDIAPAATKREIKLAVQSLYNVIPRKVAVINVPTKNKMNARTGKTGVKRGGKKAYVYLKSGETITF